jgi:hypothetical protein
LGNLTAGDRIDQFRIVERIHTGGMGVIYAVEADGSDAPLVMKVPRFGVG